MKISYSWLKDYIDLDESPEEVSDVLTQTGLEVEGLETIEKIKGSLQGLVIGEVKSCRKHPNADKLSVTEVDIGKSELAHIVCGAPNVEMGQKVIVAPINTTIYPTMNEPFKIKKTKIRGELSEGMICAEDEIGLGTAHDGIMVLDTKLENGSPVDQLFDTGLEHVIEIGLTPNRGDAASHIGTARDLKAFYQREIKYPEEKNFDIKVDNPVKVRVENTEACPRYSGYTIRNVKVGPSPEWLQQRLRTIGLEPINNIVDITNYTLHSLGQPLHAFDADEVQGNEIIVKTLENGSMFQTLDELKRTLHERDLMICDGRSNGMCIGGVFGGIKSGVKDTTTSIFLESAHFSQNYIRETAMRHGLSTDASFRFERGTDPEMTVKALEFATDLILSISGGYVASELVDIYPDKVEELTIPTKFKTFDRLIGKKIGNEKILQILESLDIKCSDISNETFKATVPAYRSEVTREADLVEEVLRIYGFNNIEIDESFSTGYLAGFEKYEPYKVQEDISKFLIGKGFYEILTNSITNQKYHEDLSLEDNEVVVLLNRSSEDLGIMKGTSVYSALESVRFNINRKKSNLKFFEFSKVYGKNSEGYTESSTLGIYLTGKEYEESWLHNERDVQFQNLSGIVLDVFDKFGITDHKNTALKDDKLFSYGLQTHHRKKTLVSFGMIRPEICRYFGIDQEVFYGEFNWDHLLNSVNDDLRYKPISKYPEVRRDLSLVLDKHISYREIEEISFNSEKKLLNRMNVFSVYEGDRIEKGKIAYAIAFYLQDFERTLNDKQIDKSMNNLMSQFEKRLGAIIRK